MKPEERRGLLYVALAAAFFSTTPVLIVWADPMPSVVKTWGRMSVGVLAVGVAALLTMRKRAPVVSPGDARSGKQSVLRFAVYGLITAFHFLFSIAALNYTTVAHAVSIIYTAPIFVTLLSAALLKEPVRGRQRVGVLVAVLGVAILAGLEPTMSWRMAFGDLLALLSAIMFGFYSVAGRYERTRYPLLVYASRVYGLAALWLLPAALLSIPSAPPGSWGWTQLGSVVAMGLGPLALGHTLYNASLRRVHATYVNIIASQEVVGGIILSFFLLSQAPSINSLVGALITLAGVGLVLL